jgi:hypothetical protein
LPLVNLNLEVPQSPEVVPICADHPRSRGKWWVCCFCDAYVVSCLI